MICYICKKKIINEIKLYNIFKKETHHICEQCYSLYPLNISEQVIPTQKFLMYWYTLQTDIETLNPMAYMSFLKPFYIDFLKYRQHAILLYFDQISDKLINILTSIEWHIYLVTFYDEIK